MSERVRTAFVERKLYLAPRILARKKIRAREIISRVTPFAREQLILGKLTWKKKFCECCTTVQSAKTIFARRDESSFRVDGSDHLQEVASENLVACASG